ncbi:MAG: polysaccharide deacetylase family protein [Burkholderiales bacterium]|nr:polysaccharide deacetylase family protein [Flavobacterium sp.]
MRYYWIKTSRVIKMIFSRYVWDIPNRKNKVYLTFDDGPTPEITAWTLAQLKEYGFRATFFCIGHNIDCYPAIFSDVINSGHAVGNHTFDHLKGWETDNSIYIKNVERCQESISEKISLSPKVFRPPYGKIKKSQAKLLRDTGYKIVMWDVLSGDFDQSISPEKCLSNVLSNVRSGSIIVFHDSAKAFKNLRYVLPKTLAYLKEKDFEGEVIR